MKAAHINPALYKRYAYPVPRYTSYPPAPHFDHHIQSEQWGELLAKNEEQQPQAQWSIYVHLPFCDTLCYFCGCNMIITHRPERVNRYLHYLHREVVLWREQLPDGHLVDQMHWGGGTPTHLSPEQLKNLSDHIHQFFVFSPQAEISCEVDPRGLSFAHLQALREAGFNRISMGVQDIDPRVQQAVNRIQPLSLTEQVIEWVRKLGFHGLNIDLMYGLPFQTAESFFQTVQQIIRLRPERIAVFHYAHLPAIKKHQSLISAADLPNTEEKIRMWLQTIDALTAAGYIFIGLDHFALPNDELSIALHQKQLYRNFQGYSTRAGTHLFGMGITGISQLPDAYAQNEKTEQAYFRSIDAGQIPTARGYVMSADDIKRRDAIMQIMCHRQIDKQAWSTRFALDFDQYFADCQEELKQLANDGLIQVNAQRIEVTDIGVLFLRQIAYVFDGYRQSSLKPVYSASL
ncbi:MAG: oxygen-independent coproporphyrinogen III oxidase [Thermoflavifilum sp.]|nr:oxygen-independent coproporphyrinogen III oxidase [Thermoflavifilum sp.]